MDATFSKSERLCKKSEFDLLFNNGKYVINNNIKAQYIFKPSSLPEIKVAFAIPSKRIKTAVNRNYLKRIMREIYRKNKYILHNHLNTHSVYITFIFLTKEVIDYKEMETNLLLLLHQILEKYQLQKR